MILSSTALFALITTVAISRAEPEFRPQSDSSSCDLTSSSSSCQSSDSSSSLCSTSDLSSLSFSSSICSSSDSSSSSSDYCDPCCAGVKKLTYQAPFGAGAYLAKVSLKFKLPDVFGPDACISVYNVAKAAGVVANLIGSDGSDLCATQAVVAATVAKTFANLIGAGTLQANNAAVSVAVLAYDTSNPVTVAAVISTSQAFLDTAYQMLALANAAQATASDEASRKFAKFLVDASVSMVTASTQMIAAAKNLFPASTLTSLDNEQNVAVASAGSVSTILVDTTTAYVAADIPYGTFYTVSRSWVLNQPVYDIVDNEVSAANSLYNCYGEYRTVYLTKSMHDIGFINNKHGNYCADACKGKPQSCLTLCGGLKRPGFLPKFEIGN